MLCFDGTIYNTDNEGLGSGEMIRSKKILHNDLMIQSWMMEEYDDWQGDISCSIRSGGT